MSATYEFLPVCDLCENIRDSSWHCETCRQNLCGRCKRSHLKSTTCMNHRVIQLSKDSKEEAKCVKHENLNVNGYCNTCSCLVCSSCLKEDHESHEMADVKKMADELRRQLSQKANVIRKIRIQHLTKVLEEISINREEYLQHTSYLRLEITDKTRILKSELDTVCDSITSELNARETLDMKSLESLENNVKLVLERISSLLSTCDMELRRKSDLLFIKYAKEMDKTLSQTENSLPTFKSIRPPTFVSSDSINRGAIAKLYGYLEQECNLYPVFEEKSNTNELVPVPQPVQICIGNVLTINLPNNDAAYCLRTLPNGNAWVGTGAQSLRLMNKNNDSLDEIPLDFYPYNLAILKNDLLLSNGQTIKKVGDGTITDFFSAAPFYSQGICKTKDDDLLVCLAKRDEGKILRLSSCGKTLQKVQFDAEGNQLYKNPTKISENPVNGDICVEDTVENCIIVVDKEGYPRFTYRGQEGDTFSPFYLTNDSYGNILIGDNSHFRIHLVSKDGMFQQYILTMEDGLYSPWGIDVDEDKNLWVGTLSGKIWVVEYIG